jgi:6-phosphogluconolactonase
MASARAHVEVFPDLSALVRAAAERVVGAANEAVQRSGRFAIALSGGSTPRPLYELLGSEAWAARVDWNKVHVFWGDERAVAPDAPQSNYRMAKEALLDRVPILASSVHRIQGELSPEAAATAYERTLREFFPEHSGASFDVLLLGLGPDGHVASLFPGTPALHETERWVVPNHSPVPPPERVTLTPPVLNRSRQVLFLVTGADKAERIVEVLDGPFEPERLPAQAIDLVAGTASWFFDRAAAARLAERK